MGQYLSLHLQFFFLSFGALNHKLNYFIIIKVNFGLPDKLS